MPLYDGEVRMMSERTTLDDLNRTSMGDFLGASADEAFHEWPSRRVMEIDELARAQGNPEPFDTAMGQIQAVTAPVKSGPLAMMNAGVMGLRALKRSAESLFGYDREFSADEIPIAEARAKVKQAGLEGAFKLPDQGTMRSDALQIMLDRGRDRREREDAIARGPSFYGVPTAGALATSFLVGAADPLNLASAFIPVIGELRYAKLMTSVGEAALARAGVRAGVGAAEGATGMAMIEPIHAFATLQEGRDYHMADALHSLMFGAFLGAGLRTGGGAIGDVLRARAGRPLFPFDAGEHADIFPRYDEIAGPAPEPRSLVTAARGERGAAEPNLPEQFPGEVAPRPHAARAQVESDIFDKLRSAGQPAREAAASAGLVASRYAARAQRLGGSQTALDLYRSEGIDVRGPGAPAAEGRAFDQGSPDHHVANALTAATELRTQHYPNLSRADQDIVGEFVQAIRGAAAKRELSIENGVVHQGDRFNRTPLAERASVTVPSAIVEHAWLEADHALQRAAAVIPRLNALKARYGNMAEPIDRAVQAVTEAMAQRGITAERSFNQSQPSFFSAVSRVLDEAKQEKAPAAQWLGMLKNKPGVKPEEMEWLGLEPWLKEQKGSVTKAQIQDFIRANQIVVKEVTKGGPVDTSGWVATRNEAQGWWDVRDPQGEKYTIVGFNDAHTADAAIRHVLEEDSFLRRDVTKFQSYQLPGGENYRELLLTLPEKSPDAEPRLQQIRDEVASVESQLYRDPSPEQERMIGDRLERLHGQEDLILNEARQSFRSQHWDEPNVIAHIRFNDRIIDGKRTLFIEEIQSDWHQAGKKKGYQRPVPPEEKTKLLAEREQLMGDTNGVGREARWDRLGEIDNVIDRGVTGVPDAPFKTTWPELSLKRMIRYASENGYDQVAWTPGKVQADRYDLSKQINHIDHWKNEDGTYNVGAYKGQPGRYEQVWHDDRATPQIIEDTLGKEVTEKIVNGEGKEIDKGFNEAGTRRLEGLDLQVGGEGMKGFYDEILPATANRLTKKYGARVGRSEIDTGPDEKAFRLAEHQGDSAAIADALVHRKEDVHTLPLTPELKSAAMGGFPLFQRGNADIASAKGRITLGSNKAIIDLFASADRSTLLHEMGHLWLDELTRDAARAGVPQALKDDLGTVLRWLGVTKAEDIGVPQHEQWARGFEQYLMEGQAPSSALARAFEQFKDWLTGIYRSLRDLGTPITDDIRGVMDRMLATDQELMERLADLPARAQEDLMRGSIARLIDGEPVNAGEMLNAAARMDPRIAESWPVDGGTAGRAATPEESWRALATSREARESLPQTEAPKSLDTGEVKSPSAKAAMEADARLAEMYEMAAKEGDISDKERAALDETLAKIDQEADAQAQVVRQGAACLMAGFGLGVMG